MTEKFDIEDRAQSIWPGNDRYAEDARRAMIQLAREASDAVVEEIAREADSRINRTEQEDWYARRACAVELRHIAAFARSFLSMRPEPETREARLERALRGIVAKYEPRPDAPIPCSAVVADILLRARRALEGSP